MSKIITKGRYMNFLRCAKRLWLEEYQPDLVAPPDDAALRRMRLGQDVDRTARDRFLGGVLIPYEPQPAEMVSRTRDALDAGANVLFQATFAAEDLLCRSDILLRRDQSWHLIEVKAGLSVKEEHLPDVAFQYYVLRQAGMPVSQVSIMHINGQCRYPDLEDLFVLADVTEQAVSMTGRITEDIAAMREVNSQPRAPQIDVGRHCQRPDRCPLYDHCWQLVPGLTIYDIPRLGGQRELRLRAMGILSLADVPADFALTENQRTFTSRINQRLVQIDYEPLRGELAGLEFPLHFLDFETIEYPVPIYAGCRPYQNVPFQYSCHILHENGALEHREFLHLDGTDPRQTLVTSLLNDIGERGHIVVYYASFERSRLLELAEAFPAHSERLLHIIGRLWDQYELIKRSYHHYGFGKSNSLKSVLPVIVPELSYEHLIVQNGSQAQAAWEQMITCEDQLEREFLMNELRRYCGLDTLAMVRIHEALAML